MRQRAMPGIAGAPSPSYCAVIFTSIRSADPNGCARMARGVRAPAAAQPGYLGMETAREDVGVTISRGSDLTSIRRGKTHTAHIGAREFGRPVRDSSFRYGSRGSNGNTAERCSLSSVMRPPDRPVQPMGS